MASRPAWLRGVRATHVGPLSCAFGKGGWFARASAHHPAVGAGTRKAIPSGPSAARGARLEAASTSSRLLEELPETDLGVAEMAHGASRRGRRAGTARQRGAAVARFATANAALQAALQLHLAAGAIV